jgi:hypothetical protein
MLLFRRSIGGIRQNQRLNETPGNGPATVAPADRSLFMGFIRGFLRKWRSEPLRSFSEKAGQPAECHCAPFGAQLRRPCAHRRGPACGQHGGDAGRPPCLPMPGALTGQPMWRLPRVLGGQINPYRLSEALNASGARERRISVEAINEKLNAVLVEHSADTA